MKKTISIMAVLVAFVVGVSVYAVEKSSDTSKDTKDKKASVTKDTDKEEVAEQAEAPKTIEACEKMIAEKTAELKKADKGKKGEIQKEIDQLKEVLKNLKEFKKSNKEE